MSHQSQPSTVGRRSEVRANGGQAISLFLLVHGKQNAQTPPRALALSMKKRPLAKHLHPQRLVLVSEGFFIFMSVLINQMNVETIGHKRIEMRIPSLTY